MRKGQETMLLAHGFGCDQTSWKFITNEKLNTVIGSIKNKPFLIGKYFLKLVNRMIIIKSIYACDLEFIYPIK